MKLHAKPKQENCHIYNILVAFFSTTSILNPRISNTAYINEATKSILCRDEIDLIYMAWKSVRKNVYQILKFNNLKIESKL